MRSCKPAIVYSIPVIYVTLVGLLSIARPCLYCTGQYNSELADVAFNIVEASVIHSSTMTGD